MKGALSTTTGTIEACDLVKKTFWQIPIRGLNKKIKQQDAPCCYKKN
jgi:hypothetical protein